MCTDDTVQKQMMNIGEGMRRDMCSKADIRREGGKFIGDSVCKIGDGTMTSHSVMTVQGDTAYKTVVSATYDPPFMGMKESTTTIEGRNTGPCRDGLAARRRRHRHRPEIQPEVRWRTARRSAATLPPTRSNTTRKGSRNEP